MGPQKYIKSTFSCESKLADGFLLKGLEKETWSPTGARTLPWYVWLSNDRKQNWYWLTLILAMPCLLPPWCIRSMVNIPLIWSTGGWFYQQQIDLAPSDFQAKKRSSIQQLTLAEFLLAQRPSFWCRLPDPLTNWWGVDNCQLVLGAW